MKIGYYNLKNNLVVAPMAGVTDRPFRQLCKSLGAGMAVSEMVTSNSLLYGSSKTWRRACHQGEVDPVNIQIAGTNPKIMAEAAVYNVQNGAQIIDINMGCPAKKICNVMAGSALLKNELLVARILESVVQAVPDTPVTLKTRLGWDIDHQNVVRIAQIAEQSGIQAIAIHGRTRCQAYRGEANYQRIAEVKSHVRIPVIANGDIDTPEKAKTVLEYTQADGIMIGRAAQGNPWIFREIAYYLATGQKLEPPSLLEIQQVLSNHLDQLYSFYGKEAGVRVARKHISWYTKGLTDSAAFRHQVNTLSDAGEQWNAVLVFFNRLLVKGEQPFYQSDTQAIAA